MRVSDAVNRLNNSHREKTGTKTMKNKEKFTEFAKYAKSQGFKTQKEFKKHVNSVREARHENPAKTRYPDFAERYKTRNARYKNLLKIVCPSIAKKSNHARYVFSCGFETGIIVYSRSSRCAPLSFFNVSYYSVGNKVISKTYFRHREEKEIFEMPENWKSFTAEHPGLLKNEIGKVSHGLLVRYTSGFKKIGIAIELDDPFNVGKKYWEHGKTISDCLAERTKKIESANQLKLNKLQKRKARLIKCLVNDYKVVVSDSLDAGNCIQGTANWLASNSILNLSKELIEQKLRENARNLDSYYLSFRDLKKLNPPRLVDYIAENLVTL